MLSQDKRHQNNYKNHYATLFKTAKAVYLSTINWDGTMPTEKALSLLEKAIENARGANYLFSKNSGGVAFITDSVRCFENFKAAHPKQHYDDSRKIIIVENCFEDALFYVIQTRKELGYRKEN